MTRACTALALSLISAAFAAAACPNAKVKVTVVVILAKDEGSDVDKRLTEIAKEIQKKDPSLKSFRIKKMMDKSLAADEKASFATVDDKTAQVIVKHGADKDNRVSLAVTAPNQGEIVYETVCGKFLPIVTRYQTKTKERLILAVRVQPCNE
jgi:aromatic ring hydroxylase